MRQGWFIFTTLLLMATLRSTLAFFSLFFSLDLAFMLLGIGYLHPNAAGSPNPPVISAGGFFALLAAFLAWYNALAGILDDSNRYVLVQEISCSCIYANTFYSFFIVPVAHFPWSVKAQAEKQKLKEHHV